ncbi:hypothetical protein [Patulibacter defluvii]|uniref:hypothetical protein n=1 Tax=Patulibacter defluvii TaxID=3095358 RepID=UPI002A75072B|nr:hypothetical protein [Patulibacter sp. DM4]
MPDRAADGRIWRGVAVTVAAVALGASGAGPSNPGAAIAATSPVAAGGRMNESISLRLVRKSGTTFRHSGTARGSVPGSARSTLKLTRLSLSGTATIRNRRGTVTMRISGRARSGGTRSRFEGTARITGGSGAYRRARGSARFTGIVDRRNWAASMNANGTLHY